MKIWALVLLVGVCATTQAGPIDQRSAARESRERNLLKLSDFSAENDLYTLFSGDQKDVPVNIVVEDEVKTLGENLEDSFENTIDVDEEHSKFKRDLSQEGIVIKDEETAAEDRERENTKDYYYAEDPDTEEVESGRKKRDLEAEHGVLTEYDEYDDDWPKQMEDGRDENKVERNLHDAVEDWPVDLVEDDQFNVSDERIPRVKRDLEKENDDDSTEEEENWMIHVIEEQDEDTMVKRDVKKDNCSDSSDSSDSSDQCGTDGQGG